MPASSSEGDIWDLARQHVGGLALIGPFSFVCYISTVKDRPCQLAAVKDRPCQLADKMSPSCCTGEDGPRGNEKSLVGRGCRHGQQFCVIV